MEGQQPWSAGVRCDWRAGEWSMKRTGPRVELDFRDPRTARGALQTRHQQGNQLLGQYVSTMRMREESKAGRSCTLELGQEEKNGCHRRRPDRAARCRRQAAVATATAHGSTAASPSHSCILGIYHYGTSVRTSALRHVLHFPARGRRPARRPQAARAEERPPSPRCVQSAA